MEAVISSDSRSTRRSVSLSGRIASLDSGRMAWLCKKKMIEFVVEVWLELENRQ